MRIKSVIILLTSILVIVASNAQQLPPEVQKPLAPYLPILLVIINNFVRPLIPLPVKGDQPEGDK
jgi:hypothetical protein